MVVGLCMSVNHAKRTFEPRDCTEQDRRVVGVVLQHWVFLFNGRIASCDKDITDHAVVKSKS